ncbi:hypothetical protein F511_18982 [Dorcoceras hygrometricum]|uniref:Uncharacterized protein n=1 Tax=Dorcoceras hygrometricum TaxID=472368 RepID=A0A2Z7CUI8_9LAMI|nr:hypothetical protein F511_18982 [Dorcoceras hygrometricum]
MMTSLLMSSTLSAPADLYRSSSILRLFLASVPAGPFAPADISSSAEHDVVTDYIIIDGPLRCSSWFSFDVPADPSSSSSACSWFLSYQLIHYAPAGSKRSAATLFEELKTFCALLLKTGGAIPLVLEHLKNHKSTEDRSDSCLLLPRLVTLTTEYFAPGCNASLIMLFLRLGFHVDWICNSTEARDWIHCSS